MQLRISMEKFSGEKATSFYDTFSIEDQVLDIANIHIIRKYNNLNHFFGFQNTFYKLNVSGFHGNGGDGLALNDGMGFTTFDQDHDSNNDNCAALDKHGGGGAWWWASCGLANPNGFNLGQATKTAKSMAWYRFGDQWECLKTISLSIRPITT